MTSNSYELRLSYLLARSLLMNACTCGYAPNRHPHTSKMAFGYFESRTSSFRPSSLQHFLQSVTMEAETENLDKSSQLEHNNWLLLKPKLLHSSGLSSVPNDKWISWNAIKITPKIFSFLSVQICLPSKSLIVISFSYLLLVIFLLEKI